GTENRFSPTTPPQKSCSGLRLAGRWHEAAFPASYGRRAAGRYGRVAQVVPTWVHDFISPSRVQHCRVPEQWGRGVTDPMS
ncbi:MAG: hypothetical protein KAY37_17225, partial [Phycisphaerae bacterium]|nr:hypothetical protein [Phycisphaerae bacterium]